MNKPYRRGVLRGMKREPWGLAYALVRIGARMSQEDMARAIHRSRQSIGRIELSDDLPDDQLTAEWVRAIGGLTKLDWIIRLLQAIRARAAFAMDFPALLQV